MAIAPFPLTPEIENVSSSGENSIPWYVESGTVASVHVMPSADIVIFPVVPIFPMATNPKGADDVTAKNSLPLAVVRVVHVVPSGEVCTLLVPMPSDETMENKDSSGDQAISRHASVFGVLAVHVVPSVEVITLFVPLDDTAHSKDNAGDHVTAAH